MIKLSGPTLRNTPQSILNLYREGHAIPPALFHYMDRLFKVPAYTKKFTKERQLAHKFYQDLKIGQLQKLAATRNYFLEHKSQFEYADVATFYHSLTTLLHDTHAHVVYSLNPQQFEAIKPNLDVYVQTANNQLVIYLHGNQILTGAPIIIGGYPHLDYFQWGNLYGVVKYEVEEGEEDSLLVYFENRHQQNLEQCIRELLGRLQYQAEHTPTSPKPLTEQLEFKPLPTAPRLEFGIAPPQSTEDKNA